MVGAILSVTVIAEDGTEASATCTEAVGDYTFEIESAEATKVNEIVVTFVDPVDSENVTITVTKGEAAVPATVEWNLTEDIATITTEAKMTKGTYTVTATDTVTEATDSIDVEVLAQYVAEIVITSDTALTDDDKHIAYAYYDVFDQYGESIRSSTSIQWTSSAQNTQANKTNGQIRFTNDTEWIYGNKIYVTGVNAKTGANVTKELPVGAEQNLDKVVMAGFVKKGTSEIVETLPADFKSNEWYMVFQALDQNGNVLAADTYGEGDVTFISDNPLVIKELTAIEENPIIVKGEEYKGVFVTPGIKVADGGEVTVTAIANKTGTKTEMNFVVGEDPVLVSFTLSAPAGIVADGDADVVIPFTAIDDKGNTITNFRTLAKQKTFNTLQFSASEGKLTLAEQQDGTAKLTWEDKDMPWTNAQTTDGLDRPVSLTAIVVGGETDNEMISVSDKRRPDAIAAVKVDSVFVEGATVTFVNTHNNGDGEFRFYDQYGTIIGDAAKYGNDNGFFAADAADSLKGSDFADHHFGVRVTYAGSGKMEFTNTTGVDDNVANPGKYTILENGNQVTFTTTTDITSAATGEGFKFEIASIKDDDYAAHTAKDWDSVSTSKYFPMTVVDITQVKNFKMNDLGTYYVGGLTFGAVATGDGVWVGEMDDLRDGTADEDEATIWDNAAWAAARLDKTDYDKTIKVTGTYNGSSVTVPVSYMDYAAVGGKLTVGPNNDGTKALITSAENEVIKASELYDKTSAVGASKLGSETIKATIKKIYSDESIGAEQDIALTVVKDGYGAAIEALDGDAATNTIVAAAVAEDADAIPQNTLLTDAYALAVEANEGIDLAIAAIEEAGLDNADDAIEALEVAQAANLAKVTLGEDGELPEHFGVVVNGPVYDTASGEVKFSDQAPKATKIVGVAESYTFTPNDTDINEAEDGYISDKLDIGEGDTVYVVDQYGIFISDNVVFRVTDVTESATGYAANSFKVTGNDSAAISITGAELGDTFTLVVSYAGDANISASTAITVGPDDLAIIENDNNFFRDALLETLDQKRLEGLG